MSMSGEILVKPMMTRHITKWRYGGESRLTPWLAEFSDRPRWVIMWSLLEYVYCPVSTTTVQVGRRARRPEVRQEVLGEVRTARV